MAICKRMWSVARINFQRWKSDHRIWIIFIVIAVLLIQELKGLTQYGLDTGQLCTGYLLPSLFDARSISIGTTKVLLYLGCLLLLCDAPFLYPNAPYVVLRSCRNSWWMGECLYILLTTFIYLVFITFISTAVLLPIATFGDSWGGVAYDVTHGTSELWSTDIKMIYKIYLTFPMSALNYLYPSGAQLYTFFTGWASFFLLGLVQYLVSLKTKSTFLGVAVAALFVFLDPFFNELAYGPAFRWTHYLSPVSWTSVENLQMMNRMNVLTIPMIVILFIVFIVLLLLGIWRTSRKVMIEIRVEE